MAELVNEESIQWALHDTQYFTKLAAHKLRLLSEQDKDNHWMLWMFLRARSYARHAAYMAARRILDHKKSDTKAEALYGQIEKALHPWHDLDSRARRTFLSDRTGTNDARLIQRYLNEMSPSQDLEQLQMHIVVRPLAHSLVEEDDIEWVARLIRDRSEVRAIAIEMANIRGLNWIDGPQNEELQSAARRCTGADDMLVDLIRSQPVPQDYALEYKERYFEPPSSTRGHHARELRPMLIELFEEANIHGPLLHPGTLPWLDGRNPRAFNPPSNDRLPNEDLAQQSIEFGPRDVSVTDVRALPGWA